MKKLKLGRLFMILVVVTFFIGMLLLFDAEDDLVDPVKSSNIKRFESGEALLAAFEDAQERGSSIRYGMTRTLGGDMVAMEAAVADGATSTSSQKSYSDTNVQVQGVDEADIIKTDGDYIYTISNNNLVIINAYPADEAEILSTTKFEGFRPNEIFIHGDHLMIFGYGSYNFEVGEPDQPNVGMPFKEDDADIYIRPYYINSVSVRLYDVSDKEDPELLRNVDFEGSYLTSRKIGEDVYFVVNTYPRQFPEPRPCMEIMPLYRDADNADVEQEDFVAIASCTDVGYIMPIQAEQFITIASMSIADENADINKEIIVGSGQNVYASLSNLYVAQTTWPHYTMRGELDEDSTEETIISKFELDDGEIYFVAKGEVPGHILNQFSMDEYDDHFRIATTKGNMWGRGDSVSTNNVYVLDEDMDLVGELEDLAPGERIYSVRFMGEKGYVVTFKKVDPLFVIDLSDHDNPDVLGKLKIPGYSDYLHPIDENHIIGIGKDTVEAGEDLVQRRQLDFAWYQGVKMAIFDVSDVENPIEMDKVIIGDRGTDSEALYNHKAFLFDEERELLVLPITLAEIQGEKSADNQYGSYVFQGAYVYNVNIEDGFEYRGRVTHYDDDDVFKKSGYYFRGDSRIRRSLYIEDVLYTLSDARLQLNDLDNLERLNVLEFEQNSGYGYEAGHQVIK